MTSTKPKTIIITGAGRGVGFETALALAAENHKVIALSRNAEKLSHLKDVCDKLHPNNALVVHPFDLTNFMDEKISDILKDVKVDVLINNAGFLINKPFEKLTDEDWHHIYNVNVFGVARLTRSLIPYFNKTKSHVVNISSMGGINGSSKFAGLSAYSSSKGALCVLTECLAEELKEKNIFVNCLALGSVQTEMLRDAFPDYEAPLSAKEMANYIHQFALTGHHFFNGKIIPVALSTP